jgi:hypothetical protein
MRVCLLVLAGLASSVVAFVPSLSPVLSRQTWQPQASSMLQQRQQHTAPYAKRSRSSLRMSDDDDKTYIRLAAAELGSQLRVSFAIKLAPLYVMIDG